MNTAGITERQKEVLSFMVDFLARNDELPPMRAMTKHFGWKSQNAADSHLRALARKGLLERNEIGNWRLRATPRERLTMFPAGTLGKRVYLAGPMSGYPELNFSAFHREAARMRADGLEVINPAEINADPSAGWVDCMRADIRELVTCDSIALLPGWEKSRGASLEYHIARQLGLSVVYIPREVMS